MSRKLVYPGIYRHFKNKYYATMGITTSIQEERFTKLISDSDSMVFESEHTETGKSILVIKKYNKFYISTKDSTDVLVVYKTLYDNSGIWVRPIDLFLSEVDHDKYPGIEQKYRFELYDYKEFIDKENL